MNPRYDDFTSTGTRDRRESSHCRADTGARVRAYLRSLTAEHWLLFCAGLVIGLVLG